MIRIIRYADLLDHLAALERYTRSANFEVLDDLDRVACCEHITEGVFDFHMGIYGEQRTANSEQ